MTIIISENVEKNFEFKTVSNGSTTNITQLKQQKLKSYFTTLLHIEVRRCAVIQ